jgi:hypothetical protein
MMLVLAAGFASELPAITDFGNLLVVTGIVPTALAAVSGVRLLGGKGGGRLGLGIAAVSVLLWFTLLIPGAWAHAFVPWYRTAISAEIPVGPLLLPLLITLVLCALPATLRVGRTRP